MAPGISAAGEQAQPLLRIHLSFQSVELPFFLEISALMGPRKVLIFRLLSFVVLAVAIGWG